MIPFLKGTVALASLFAAATLCQSASGGKPNIVFYLVDDLGWTDLSCFGSETYETPNIDRLAREGMRFNQAYATCTVCSPTRASILTGNYPARLRVTDWIGGHDYAFARLKSPDWIKHLPLEVTTLAEELKARGYATALFGKWHLGTEEHYPEYHGFDLNIGGTERGLPRSYFPPYAPPGRKLPGLEDERPGEFLTDRLTTEAMTFIDANRDRPFLLYFSYYAVHAPIEGKQAVIEKYKRKIREGMVHDNAIYAALVEALDDSVGAIQAKIADLGLAGNTVIIFTSDNGGDTGRFNKQQQWQRGPTRNDPLRMGKGSAYEGGVRVPQIVKWPGVTRPGSVSETPVSSIDFFPTILDMADGRRAPRHVDGESLVPLLKQAGHLQRDAIFWHYPHYHPGSAAPHSAIRSGQWKLIEFLEDGQLELYNLHEDLGETRNLAAANPKRATELRARLEAWRTEVGAQMPTPNPAFDPASQRFYDPPAGAQGRAARAPTTR